MARKPRPVDPTAGPLQEFAHALRQLREKAGNPTYRALAHKAGFGATALGEAAGGVRFPSLDVTLAYVGACGGDPVAWEERWRRVESELTLGSPAAEDESSTSAGIADDQSARIADEEVERARSPRSLERIWSRTSWASRAAYGCILVIIIGTGIFVTTSETPPAARGATVGSTLNVDQICPTFPTPGAFDGETYLDQTAIRTASTTSARLIRNVPRSCWLQFTGYCLGAVILDRNIVGAALPDERWFEIEGGNLMSSAVVHGDPPAGMRPSTCPGSVGAPKSISLGIVSDPGVPGAAVLSAQGSGVLIAGYAAYFAPVDAPGTAPDWHQVGAPGSLPATGGFAAPWTVGRAGQAPSSTPVVVVAAACLAGDTPTDVTDAVQVVPSNPKSARPAALPAAMLARAAKVACAIP